MDLGPRFARLATIEARPKPSTSHAAGYRTSLTLRDLELAVRLGCGAAERSTPQRVRLVLHVHFATPPNGCWTDELGDTVCYAELAELARAHSASREFKLVESLAFELHELLSSRLPEGAHLDLELIKVAPPIPDLHGGVCFRIEDDRRASFSSPSRQPRPHLPSPRQAR